MSQPLVVCLIAVAVNLAGMFVIYSLMAFALVRLSWRRRGLLPVLVTIVIAGIFWIAPTILAFNLDPKSADAVSYSLWLGNWLVSGFSVVMICQTIKGIPRQLEDTARLDGCGSFGIYRHVLFPLARRELGIIAFLTLMATTALCWTAVIMPGSSVGSSDQFIPPWIAWILRGASLNLHGPSNPGLATLVLAEVAGGAIIVTLPVILLFFISKPSLSHTPDPGGTDSVPSTS